MKKSLIVILTILASLVSIASLAIAEESDSIVPAPTGEEIGEHQTSGDNPLSTYYTFSGNGGVVIATVGSTAKSGSFTVSGIPSGSTIVKAVLYTASWEYTAKSISASFAEVPLGSVMTFSHDPGVGYATYDLNAWRWDVTSLVTGNGVYSWYFTGRSQPYGNALVIVYSNPLSPFRQIFINDGSESLYYATSITTFSGVLGGPATLMIFEQAGDWSDGVEEISFNGVTVLGPANIFNGNLGYAASLNTVSVSTIAGANTASITTGVDWLGWHLAILTVTPPVNQPPVANANGPYTGNEGSSIVFDASGSTDPDGTIVLYEWDLDGDGQYDDATGVNPQYTWPDDYIGTIGLKVTDDGGLTDTDSTTVTVNNVPPTANAGPDQTIIAGDTVNFAGSMTDPGWLDTHTYEWDFDASDGIGIDATGQTPTHIYYDAGVYTVTLTVTDDNGGVGTDTLQVTVKPIPATIDCDPNTLNLKSKGDWITCYIELPAGYDVRDIDATTILLNGLIPPELNPKYGFVKSEQSYIMDHDGDGILERMVKFERAAVQAILSPDQAVLTLTGEVSYNLGLADFEGKSTIRVIGQPADGDTAIDISFIAIIAIIDQHHNHIDEPSIQELAESSYKKWKESEKFLNEGKIKEAMDKLEGAIRDMEWMIAQLRARKDPDWITRKLIRDAEELLKMMREEMGLLF